MLEKVRFPSPCNNVEEEEKLLADIWGLNYTSDESTPEKAVCGISQIRGQEFFEVLVNEGGSSAVVEVLNQFVDKTDIEVIKENEEPKIDSSEENNNEGGVDENGYAILRPYEREMLVTEAKNQVNDLMALSFVRRTGRICEISPKDRQEIIDQALNLAKKEYHQNES